MRTRSILDGKTQGHICLLSRYICWNKFLRNKKQIEEKYSN